MNFINTKETIPFRQELMHIQNYADIEKLRFKERLEIKFDIQTEDFEVPTLSIQPLVENAIRHGACKNINKGTVMLKTLETDKEIYIEITDDGPGFDTSKIYNEEKEPHGIQNVIFRLEQINAKITFESYPNKGSTVLIILAKECEE